LSSFQKECKYCHVQIELNDRDGNWRPYSLNTGKLHYCLDSKPKYDRQKLEQLAISHIGDIPQLDPLNEEQEAWVKRRMNGPSWTWKRWYE
jgi:hypothetical protein